MKEEDLTIWGVWNKKHSRWGFGMNDEVFWSFHKEQAERCIDVLVTFGMGRRDNLEVQEMPGVDIAEIPEATEALCNYLKILSGKLEIRRLQLLIAHEESSIRLGRMR